MHVLVLVVVVLVQLTAGQQSDPFAMFNTNNIVSGSSNDLDQPTQPDAISTNTFGQQPAPTQFGQPQPNSQQQPPAAQFGQQQNQFGQQQNQFGQQQSQFGQQPQAQPGSLPNNQFGGNNPTMSFQQPQFGQQQTTFGGPPNSNRVGNQPGGFNNGMPQGNNQQQLTPDQAFLVGGQWNQQQQQQNNGRTMFSSFDPNNPVPFQQQGGQQNGFGNGQFGGAQQNPQTLAGSPNFLSFGTSGNDFNTFQDNNLPVGEVDNIRFGIGPNQQPFRMDVGTMNFGGQNQQPQGASPNNLSPFTPFAPGNGGMPGGAMGAMPGVGMGGMPMAGIPGGFDSGFGGGFGGPAIQGFGSFLPPPPPPQSGGIFSRLFGRSSGGGFFSGLFGKKK